MKDAGPTPMTGRQIVGCNVYSSGEENFLECIVPRAYKVFLDYFKLVHQIPDYEATPQDIPDANEQEEESAWGVPAKDDESREVKFDATTAGEAEVEKAVASFAYR